MSEHTIDLLLAHGFVYDSSLMGADYWPYRARRGDHVELGEPYRNGEETTLIEMPISWSLDDYPHFEFVRTATTVLPGLQSARTVMENWLDEFRYMQKSVDWGVLTYTMHPYVIGRGYRMLALEDLVAKLTAAGAVFMTMEDAAKETQARLFATLIVRPSTTERHVFIAARRPIGDVHRAGVEIDEHRADRHGALGIGLLRIGMAADAVGRAEMVGRGVTHVVEGERAAMRLQQFAHAVGAVERVRRDFFHQRLAVARFKKMVGMGQDAIVVGMQGGRHGQDWSRCRRCRRPRGR